MSATSDRHTFYDLKLLVDCYFKADDGLYVADGFKEPSRRLERLDLVERDPSDNDHVRITTKGVATVGSLIDYLRAGTPSLTGAPTG